MTLVLGVGYTISVPRTPSGEGVRGTDSPILMLFRLPCASLCHSSTHFSIMCFENNNPDTKHHAYHDGEITIMAT